MLALANLREANLQCANLQGACLECADLQGADLFDANLEKSQLVSVNLREASLYGATLRGAIMWSANLSGARSVTSEQILSTRDWRGTTMPRNLKYLELPTDSTQAAMDRLGRTWLRAADLRGADLDAPIVADVLSRTQILSARDWRGARLPVGLKYLELPLNASDEAMDRLGRTWKPEKKPG